MPIESRMVLFSLAKVWLFNRLEELRRSSVKRSYEAINASSSSSRGRDDYAWDAKRVATTDRYVRLAFV